MISLSGRNLFFTLSSWHERAESNPWPAKPRKQPRTSVTRFCENSPLWPNFLIFVKWLKVYSVFGKLLNLLWQNCNVFGQPFNVVYGQILKNNIATWSHCDNSRLISIHLIRTDTLKLSFSFFLPFLISLSFFLSFSLSFFLSPLYFLVLFTPFFIIAISAATRGQ